MNPITATPLLDQADHIIHRDESRRAYGRLTRALKHHVTFNRLMVAGAVVDDLASVGIPYPDMSLALHRRVFGADRLTTLIDQNT